MEAQQGFVTACGLVDKFHDSAIDDLAPISRGRVVVSKRLKSDLLKFLVCNEFTAATLDYPGADIVAARLCREVCKT